LTSLKGEEKGKRAKRETEIQYNNKVIGYFKNSILALALLSALDGFAQVQSPQGSQQAKYTPHVEIPSFIIERPAQIEYVADHYWDDFHFNDTTLIHNADYTEQGYVAFLAFLVYMPMPAAQQAMTAMMDKAAANKTTFNYFAKTSELYLYEPESPYKNDELYVPVLQSVVSSPLLDEVEKTRPRYLLNLELKNRPGAQAIDFTYTLKNGSQHRMRDLKADYTILFFNYPDCPGCKMVKEDIVNVPFISKQGNRLAVLAVYPNDDGHLEMWKSAPYPDFMINSYDKTTTVLNKQLYDLKASPTIYLLDKDKKVILKNTTLEQIEQYFESFTSPGS